MQQIVLNQLEEFSKISSERINIIFEQEMLVFTMDSTFEKETNFSPPNENRKNVSVYGFRKRGSLSLQEHSEKLQEIIDVYLKIVHTRLTDLIPMSIRQCLHVELSENLMGKLSEFAATPNIKIAENRIVRDERIKLENKINRLRNARDELSKF